MHMLTVTVMAVFPVMLDVGDYVSAINFKGDNDYLNSSSSPNWGTG